MTMTNIAAVARQALPHLNTADAATTVMSMATAAAAGLLMDLAGEEEDVAVAAVDSAQQQHHQQQPQQQTAPLQRSSSTLQPPSPGALATTTTPVATPKSAQDSSPAQCTVILKLPDGSRTEPATLSTAALVHELYEMAAKHTAGDTDFVIATQFPRQDFDELGATLADAGLRPGKHLLIVQARGVHRQHARAAQLSGTAEHPAIYEPFPVSRANQHQQQQQLQLAPQPQQGTTSHRANKAAAAARKAQNPAQLFRNDKQRAKEARRAALEALSPAEAAQWRQDYQQKYENLRQAPMYAKLNLPPFDDRLSLPDIADNWSTIIEGIELSNRVRNYRMYFWAMIGVTEVFCTWMGFTWVAGLTREMIGNAADYEVYLQQMAQEAGDSKPWPAWANAAWSMVVTMIILFVSGFLANHLGLDFDFKNEMRGVAEALSLLPAQQHILRTQAEKATAALGPSAVKPPAAIESVPDAGVLEQMGDIGKAIPKFVNAVANVVAQPAPAQAAVQPIPQSSAQHQRQHHSQQPQQQQQAQRVSAPPAPTYRPPYSGVSEVGGDPANRPSTGGVGAAARPSRFNRPV